MGIAVGSCSLYPELGKAIDLWHETPYHLLVKFLLALLLIFFKQEMCFTNSIAQKPHSSFRLEASIN